MQSRPSARLRQNSAMSPAIGNRPLIPITAIGSGPSGSSGSSAAAFATAASGSRGTAGPPSRSAWWVSR
jgi:hypothetical protein